MRHNKKRNSALLYEFLIRHISKCLINNKKDEATKALSLSKKYFSKGTVLHEELKLFNFILGTKVKSRESAQRIVDEVLSDGLKLNFNDLDIEKSKLIKEINYTLGEEVYDYKIPNYTTYASVQTLMSNRRSNNKLLDTIQRVKMEEHLVDSLLNENKDNVVDKLKIDPNYNNAVYKFVVQRFHKKYDNKLTEGQKKFLTKYAVYLISENKGIMQSSIQKEVENVKAKLKNVKDVDVLRDKELMSKLTECYRKVSTTNFENISEENVLSLLEYMKLAEEIES